MFLGMHTSLIYNLSVVLFLHLVVVHLLRSQENVKPLYVIRLVEDLINLDILASSVLFQLQLDQFVKNVVPLTDAMMVIFKILDLLLY